MFAAVFLCSLFVVLHSGSVNFCREATDCRSCAESYTQVFGFREHCRWCVDANLCVGPLSCPFGKPVVQRDSFRCPAKKRELGLTPDLTIIVAYAKASSYEGKGGEREEREKGVEIFYMDLEKTVLKFIEISRKYKMPLCLLFIDLKAFSSVETEPDIEALDNASAHTQQIKTQAPRIVQ
ncbi:hypothetical protein RB195_024029 [Necator americanus]|uniref:Uncharacterized protein n=1 Tax=Necator americanus TaxID=51031 RepID=A0ABR1ELZ7_NECAM